MAGLNTLNYQKKKIIIRNTANQRLPLSRDKIEKIAAKLITSLRGAKSLALGITFLTDKQIRQLNKKYLMLNRPTDVLSFNYTGQETADIVISLDTAKRNAKIYRTSYKNELILYLIHGFLHLSGYDDSRPRAKRRMFSKQETLFYEMTRTQ